MEQLTSVKSLTMLSLLHNPVVTRRNYREYVIHKFPNLRVLDFKKVKDKEREAAKKLFKTKEGKTQLKDISRKAKTFTPGDPLPEATNKTTNSAGLTPEQVQLIVFLYIFFQHSYKLLTMFDAGAELEDCNCKSKQFRRD